MVHRLHRLTGDQVTRATSLSGKNFECCEFLKTSTRGKKIDLKKTSTRGKNRSIKLIDLQVTDLQVTDLQVIDLQVTDL